MADLTSKEEISRKDAQGGGEFLSPFAPKPASQDSKERAWTLFWMFCISLGLCGLLIVNNSTLWNRLVGTSYAPESVGVLTIQGQDVRYRPSGSLVWMDVTAPTQKVGDGDTVFTAATSTASLRLRSGATAQISPNSLVVIQEKALETNERGLRRWIGKTLETRTQVNILEGTVTLGFTKGAKPLDLKILGKNYRVQADRPNSGVKISVDPANPEKQVSISSAGSDIRVESEGKTAQIVAGKRALVSAKKEILVEEEVFTAKYPGAKARLVAPEAPQSQGKGALRLEWDRKKQEAATLEIEGAESVRLPIAKEALQAVALLGAGQYRWRILSPSQKSGTPWLEFSLLVVSRPAVRSPLEASRFQMPSGAKEKEIGFTLEHANKSFSLEHEIHRKTERNGLELVVDKDKNAKGGHAGQFTQNLGPGRYQIRARSFYEGTVGNKRVLSPWTEPVTFEVTRAPPPSPPPQPPAKPAMRASTLPAKQLPPSRLPASKTKPVPQKSPHRIVREPLIIYP